MNEQTKPKRSDKHQHIWAKIKSFIATYHILKTISLVVMTCFLLFSTYLLVLAKTTDVKALKSGLEQSTYIYDNQEQEAGRLFSQKGTYVQLDMISPYIKDAVLSTEDKRFYEHKGVDLLGIGRSMVGFVTSGFKVVGGGSTLTQQLAKNAYLTQNQTFIRKAQELFLALEIEKHYSKDDILTMYLNHAYFGYGVWGVEDASRRYFGKSAKDVTLSEAAMIAGMLKSPTYYNPIDYPDNATNRRQIILALMKNNQKISAEQETNANQEAITITDAYTGYSQYKYPYYFDAVISEAKQKYGIDEEDLLTKGYKIYTTLDQTYQQKLDNAYANQALFPDAADGTLVQSASVIADPSNGGIMALVGGRGDHVFLGFNRATQMLKQPGSTLKPLAVYTPALENGYSAKSILLDQNIAYGSDNYTPTNWNHETVGELPMYEALIQSKNTSAVWLLNKLGIDKGLEKLKQFGIATEKEDNYLGIALGGMHKGVSPLTMTSAYVAFANKGTRYEPYFITKIVDATGAVVVNKTYTDSTRVMSEKVADEMTSMMLGVYAEGGTGGVQLPSGAKLAGKTGTTEFSDKGVLDQWSIAYTPDFVLTTWMGFDKTDDTHHLGVAYNESIHPFFNQAANNILAVSPKTAFSESSVKEVVEAQKAKEASKTWLDKAGEQLDQFGKGIQKGASDLWNAAVDFFNGNR